MMWQDRVTRAQKHKLFTRTDHEKARRWASCAINENPNIIRFGNGIPTETNARALGLEFMNAVERGWFYKAEKILKQIQSLKQ